MNVGVMKDYKLRDLRASHTLCYLLRLKGKKKNEVRGFCNFEEFPFWNLVVKMLFEVQLESWRPAQEQDDRLE
jgi:hypothetical protein